MRTLAGSAIRWSLLATVACLMQSVWTNNVLASCGDYVHTAGHGAHLMARLPAKGPGQQALPPGSDHSDAPCHGPNCSRRSPAPLQQPTTFSSSSHDWGLFFQATSDIILEPSGAIVFEQPRYALLRADELLRPPQRA